MKKLLSLLSLLLIGSIGVWAQSWTPPDGNKYQTETVVYATIESNVPVGGNEPVEVAAFIDGECRAVATQTSPNNGSLLFTFRVYGNTDELNSKEITFKLFFKTSKSEYVITTKDGSKVMFDGESAAYPSNAIVLQLNAATSYSMANFTINVGDEVNLLDRLVTEPEGAQLPDNAYWVKYDYGGYITLDGNIIKGISPGTVGFDLYVPDPNGDVEKDGVKYSYSPSCQPSVTVILPATGIEIVTDTYNSWVGDDRELTFFMKNMSNWGNSYRLVPQGSTATVKWEVNSEYIAYEEGLNCPWMAIKGGTTQIRPYFETADGTKVYPADNKWITVNISIPVEDIQLNTVEFHAAKGDDISSRVPSWITFTPSDATNQELIYTAADPQYLQVNEDGSIIAIKGTDGGFTTLNVRSPELDKELELRVYIDDYAQNVTFTESPLTITINSREGVDIKQAIFDNLNLVGDQYWVYLQPSGTASFLTYSVPQPSLRRYYSTGEPQVSGSLTATDAGEATVRVHLTWFDYTDITPSSPTPRFAYKTANFDLPIKVILDIPVTDIAIKEESLYANVGDDITERMNANVTVLPEDATNKALDWEVDGVNIVDNDGRFIATKRSWDNVIQVFSQGNPDVSAEFEVTILDPVKTVNAPDDPLTLTITTYDAMTDFTQQIVNNINMVGYVDDNVSVTVTASGKMNGAGEMTGNGYSGDPLQTNEEGETTITVVAKWNDWANYSGEGDVPVQTVTTSFKVVVTAQIDLTGFTLKSVNNGAPGESGTVILTPIPANATYNTSDISVNWEMLNLYADWTDVVTVTTTKNANNELVIEVESQMPGTVMISIQSASHEQKHYYIDGVLYYMYDVPDKAQLPAGWSWRTNPYGMLVTEVEEDETLLTDFFNGDDLYEVRTQQDLLINDPNWGYFGTMTQIPQGMCYKVKMNKALNSVIYGGWIFDQSCYAISLNAEGYTWVGNPYLFDRLLSNALKSSYPEGLVVISKESGSAEWDGSKWVGDLDLLKRSEGYMVYNPGEAVTMVLGPEYDMSSGNETATNHARANMVAGQPVWQYDASQFMSNMTMVATLPELDNLDEWTLGAFVGDECRGEGRIVDGKVFITVHSNGKETASFKLYNYTTGEYFDIDETVDVKDRVGSLRAPVQLHSTAVVTGIEEIENAETSIADSSSAIYNQNGVRQQQMRRGVNIVRMADGTVKKILVK